MRKERRLEQRRCRAEASVPLQKVEHSAFPLADFARQSNSARLPLRNSRSADSRYSSRRGLYSAMQFRRHGLPAVLSLSAPETYFFVPPVAMPASVFSAVSSRVTRHSRGALRQPTRPARAAFALNLLPPPPYPLSEFYTPLNVQLFRGIAWNYPNRDSARNKFSNSRNSVPRLPETLEASSTDFTLREGSFCFKSWS